MAITSAILRSLAPLTINAATVPVMSARFSPGALDEPFSHSGVEFATHNRQPGSAPRLMVTMPFKDAYSLIGFKSLKCTTLNLYEAKYVDGIRASGSVHRKYPLASSAVAHATIRSVTLGGTRAMATAEVEFVYLAAPGTATVHPIGTPTDNNALPAIDTGPTLHTGGPISIEGTHYAFLESVTLDTGNQLEAFEHAGDRYPTICQYAGGAPVVRGVARDPVTLLDDIGFDGQAVAAINLWFRDVDGTNGTQGTTGLKLAITRGLILPDGDLDSQHRGVDSLGFRITCLADPAAPTTHPWAVTLAQTVPT